MSHFIVIARVPNQKIAEGGLNGALSEMMAPYEEQTEDDRFLVFEDKEDEFRQQYDTDGATMIELENGMRVLPWDDRFLVPGSFGIGSGSHKPPDHLKRVNVPHKERYATFEEFMADWYGDRQRDPKTGRYGYWRNPNKTWDWYQIGGRWRGYFPVKPDVLPYIGEAGTFDNEPNDGGSDVVTVSAIDMDRVARESRESADRFWAEWLEFIAGKHFDGFDGPRHAALEMGLVIVRQGAPEPGEESRALPWSAFMQCDDSRYGWHDIYKAITRAEFDRDYADYFCTIAPYAVLDDAGWHAPGRMGWFGVSFAEADATLAFKRGFMKWLRETPEDAVLVAVDCHI